MKQDITRQSEDLRTVNLRSINIENVERQTVNINVYGGNEDVLKDIENKDWIKKDKEISYVENPDLPENVNSTYDPENMENINKESSNMFMRTMSSNENEEVEAPIEFESKFHPSGKLEYPTDEKGRNVSDNFWAKSKEVKEAVDAIKAENKAKKEKTTNSFILRFFIISVMIFAVTVLYIWAMVSPKTHAGRDLIQDIRNSPEPIERVMEIGKSLNLK